MDSNTWCPRLMAWIILSGSAVHVKGFGSALCSMTKRLIAACKSTTECMRVWRMRTGISIALKPADRRRPEALARDRNNPHKHVWRAAIVLLSADGVGTNEIMRRTGKSKTCVWSPTGLCYRCSNCSSAI
jgi:hypothetical protein